MKGEKLFGIIGLVDDDLIEAAEEAKSNEPGNPYEREVPVQKTRRPGKILSWQKWIAAACVLMFIAGGGWYAFNPFMFSTMGSGEPVSNEESPFMHDAGAIGSLRVLGDSEGLRGTRSVAMDLTDQEFKTTTMKVTDEYTLHNETDSARKVEVVYPFVGQLTGEAAYFPGLTLNGEALNSSLAIGEPVEARSAAFSFEDQEVTVFTFHDVSYPEAHEAATLAVEFEMPANAKVLTYGMNGFTYNRETSLIRLSYFLSRHSVQKVVVLGGSPSDFTVKGYRNGGEVAVDGDVTGTVRMETAMLTEVVKESVADYRRLYVEPENLSSLSTDQIYEESVLRAIYMPTGGEEGEANPKLIGVRPGMEIDPAYIRLDDVIAHAIRGLRPLYIKSEFSIPQGEFVTLTSSFLKGASHDFQGGGSNRAPGTVGYELQTDWGSGLDWTEQNIELLLPPTHGISDENFGFAFEEGKYQSVLEPGKKLYYVTISPMDAQK